MALRWDDRIGSLEEGKAADLTVLDGAAPHLMALQHLPTDLMRWASRAEVRQTMVEGPLLYDAGEFPTIDLEGSGRRAGPARTTCARWSSRAATDLSPLLTPAECLPASGCW